MFLPVFVCLSVCLLARLLKNVCMDLDQIPVIVWTPEPDCFLRYRIGTSQPCLGCQRAALLCGILCQENPMYTYWRRATRAIRGFKAFLFTEPSEHLCRR